MKIKIILNTNPFFSASASASRWLTLIEGLNKFEVSIQLLIIGNFQIKAEKDNYSQSSNVNGIEIKYLTNKIVEGLWQSRFHTYVGKHLHNKLVSKKIKKELLDFEGFVWAENDLAIWKTLNQIVNRKFKLIAEMSEFLDIHNYNKGNLLQRKLFDSKQIYFEQNYINKLDSLVLMTKTLMKHYEQFSLPYTKLLHLPMTVDLERFEKSQPILEGFQQPYIAFVGMMNDAKDGVNILIKSFAKIHKQFPQHKLYLVGAWNYDTPIHHKLIANYNLQSKVFWKGEFPREKIPQIIKNASLLALPRPDSKQAQGGFPTKLGEYLATSNPVCATTVGEIPNYLIDEQSVFFAEPGSIESFANAMEKALKNQELAKQIGKKGWEVAKTSFNKDIQSVILYNFLKQLINEN